MAVVVTEKFSVKRFSKQPPWSAYREFDVTGVGTSESAALSAVDAVDATKKVPQLNEGHPDNLTRLKCKGPKIVSRPGPQHFCVGADYIIAPTGTLNDNDDPLLVPVKVRVENVEDCEAVDLDLDDRPMIYSNGEPIQGLSRPIFLKRVTLIKNFLYWNWDWNKLYENAVNKYPITLVGGPVIKSQHLRICSIIPTTEYSIGAAFYPIGATIEFIADDQLGIYPFQHRVMDQGTRGFSSDGVGLFVNALGEPVSAPLKLDGTGKPMSVDGQGTYKVKTAAGAVGSPVANPGTNWTAATVNSSNPAGSGTDGSVLVKSSNSNGTIGWFKKVRVVDVLPFLMLFNS